MEGAQRSLEQRRRVSLGSLLRLREVRQEPERGGKQQADLRSPCLTTILTFLPVRRGYFCSLYLRVRWLRPGFFLPGSGAKLLLKSPEDSAAALVRCVTAGSRWNRAEGSISSRRVRNKPVAGRNLACRKQSVSPSAKNSWQILACCRLSHDLLVVLISFSSCKPLLGHAFFRQKKCIGAPGEDRRHSP